MIGEAPMSTVEISQPPISAEIAREYAGRWVALRAGTVIADAESYEELRADERVRRDDAVYLVPEPSSYFF
jgi:hypothetical protein